MLSPFRYGDKVYFTATVPAKRGSGKVSRIFSTLHDEPAQMFPLNPKEDGIHAAHASLNSTADRMYYTVFKEGQQVNNTQSEIWYRDKKYDGTWGNIVMLPRHVNLQGTVNTQPACGYDLLMKKDLLFFASNRPGGRGGFDIWYCTVERDGSFSPPFNLPFNTTDDEVTPHFFNQGQALFFSSKMPGGMGGLDIYHAEKNAAGIWQSPENLGTANTAFDELYFSYHQPSQTSYFCSNRPNDNCQNAPTGCPDFFVFTAILGGSLQVSIGSSFDSTPLYGCNIELMDASTGLIEMSILQSEVSSLQLPLLPEKKYRLIVSHVGFYPIFLDLEPGSTDFFRPLKKEVYLRPMR